MAAHETPVVWTIAGVTEHLDSTISALADHKGITKELFLRQYLEKTFGDIIRNYSVDSRLVSALDEEICRYCGVGLLEGWHDNAQIASWNRSQCRLLDIEHEEHLNEIVLNNTPFLHLRARQIAAGRVAGLSRGISVTFALFTELAGRSRETIDKAWREIYYSDSPEKRARFYNHIDEIRHARSLEPVTRQA
ncbi:hypothetical protein [Entomohabitans teleogrylli]|uniref:hypothetical protein n=1 Tax=Entomohabitans teleogrylli TaxID=1384589 RepID=UPI00073D27EA|nr:hypothetical protein [Entomohabitans teleogrylli]